MLHIQQTPEAGEGSAAKKGRGLVGRVVAAAVSVVMLGSMSFAPGLALADSAQTTTQNNTTVVAGDTSATTKASDVSKVQAAVNALPDTTVAGFAVTADNVNTLNQQLEAAQSAYKALSATQQSKVDMTHAANLAGAIQAFKQAQADAGDVTATWPEGVTDEAVKDYIFKNFSTDQFADAVWTAISTSGQDFTGTYDDDNFEPVTLRSAADVVKYYEGSIVVASSFQHPLTGLTLLNHADTLTLSDTSNWSDLSFIEDVYSGEDSDPTLGGPKSDKGPAIVIEASKSGGISKLPKKTYSFNLTRSSSGMHKFPSAYYNGIDTNILRDGNQSSQISIDTKLVASDGSDVVFADKDLSGKEGQTSPTRTDVSYPAVNDGAKDKSASPISTNGNVINMSISSCSADGSYIQNVNFDKLYQYYAGTSPQYQSTDYHYRLRVSSLSTANIIGSPEVISGFRVKKVGPSGEPLSNALFDVYTDEARTQKATQVIVDSDNKPEWDASGKLKVTEVPTTATDEKGYLTIKNLLPGTYYLQEVSAPDGYDIISNADLKPITVSSTIGTGKQPTIDTASGETSEAEVLSSNARYVAEYRGDYYSWNHSGQLTNASGATNTYVAKASEHGGQVFIKNKGSKIVVSSDGITKADSTKVLSGYKVGDKSFDTLQEAVDYVNGVIADGQLSCTTPTITIDGSKAVYLDTSYKKADPIKVEDPVKGTTFAFKAGKTFTEGNNPKEFKEGDFHFTLEPKNDNAKRIAKAADLEQTKPVVPNAGQVGTGSVEWNAFTVDNAEFKQAAKENGVATYQFEVYENKGSDENINYDSSKHVVEVKISEGASGGLTGQVYVDGKTVGNAFGSTSDPANPVVIDTVTFGNTVKGEFKFTKVDGSDDKNTPLAGATFRLYQCSDASLTCATSNDPITDFDNPGNGWKVVADQTSAADTGLVHFTGLSIGKTYRLVEIKAPDGYLRPAGQWKVTVTEGSSEVMPVAIPSQGTQPPAFKTDGGQLSLPNYTPMQVPESGSGWMIVSNLLGFALVLTGATVVTMKRRRAQLQ